VSRVTYINFANLSNRETAFLAVAKYCASKSTARRKHGAIVVKSGRILGTGFNKDRNDPMIVSPEHIKTQCSVHAEVDAMRDANYNVNGATLYVARINRHGEERNSKPCSYCQVAISKSKIKKVIYTEG